MDRTVRNGTGHTVQYPSAVASQMLKSGMTVFHNFYDPHYAGAGTAQKFSKQWEPLQD